MLAWRSTLKPKENHIRTRGVGIVIQERQQRGNKRSDPAHDDSGFGKIQSCTATGGSARHFDVSTFEDWGIEADTRAQTRFQSGLHIKYRSSNKDSTSNNYVSVATGR